MFTRAGKMAEVRPLAEAAPYYWSGMGGGDPEYWKSIPRDALHSYPYSATFSNLGPGMVEVIVVGSGPSAGQIRGIAVGLSANRSDSKQKLVRLGVAVFKDMGMPTPPNVEDLISKALERDRKIFGSASIAR
jgi:hypothetical protein